MKYPTGMQDFSKIRELNLAYVDKTMYIRLLLENPGFYFLSRPRRFGKSLFVSTLHTYFDGCREAFHGLDIDTDEVDWTPRPVFKFEFNAVRVTEKKFLDQYLDVTISGYEDNFGVENKGGDFSDRFINLLRCTHKKYGRKAVVLVDEYDALLLNTLDNEDLNTYYRETLKSLFTVLKNADREIYFAFITGISKFSHTSLFSGTNNLEDISLDVRYSSICGITEEEVRTSLMQGVDDFANELGISREDMLKQLKDNYDGYHFSKKSPDIYNPYSMLLALKRQEISNYWFESGTPDSFLRALKRDNFFMPDLDCLETVDSKLSAKESYLQNPVTLMYEAGYITIKGYDADTDIYTLGLPNKEVAVSFSEALLPIYSGMDKLQFDASFTQMRKAVLKGEPEKFMEHLKTFLQGNPYSNSELKKREIYFKNNIFLIFKALGFMPRVEEETCNSRMDVMLRTRRLIYVFELKTDGSADIGMQQIDEKGYAVPYADEGRTIIKIAANYSSASNNIDSYKIEISNKASL